MTMIKCDVEDCDNKATKKAKFVIYAKTKKKHPPATGSLSVCSCDIHASEENAKDLLSNNMPGRKMIEYSFSQQGLMKPCWKKSYAEWVDL